MNSQKVIANRLESQEDLNNLIIDCIQDIKGKNIIKLDMRYLDDAPANYFIICEGESSTQVKAISDNVCQRVKIEKKVYPNHVEGTQHARWILVDYFDTVVHIFYPETRSYYDLEGFWSDAKLTEYQNL